jgi:hypothetical protein
MYGMPMNAIARSVAHPTAINGERRSGDYPVGAKYRSIDRYADEDHGNEKVCGDRKKREHEPQGPPNRVCLTIQYKLDDKTSLRGHGDTSGEDTARNCIVY